MSGQWPLSWSPGRTLPPASARSVASDGPVPVREDATYYQQENRNGDTNLIPVPAGAPGPLSEY